MGYSIYHSPLLPLHSHLKQSKPTSLFWLSIKEPVEVLRRKNNQYPSSVLPLRTQSALTTTSLLPLDIQSNVPSSPKLSVFILTSVLFLSLFWITNFVVPDKVTKYLESKEASEAEDPSEVK